jgi:hypothetical protein
MINRIRILADDHLGSEVDPIITWPKTALISPEIYRGR